MPIKEIGRKHGFSDASFYKWRSKYAGMDASEAKRLRELELENGVNDTQPVAGLSTISQEHTAILAALTIKKPTLNTQLTLL